jgi:hypothetical protein
LSCVHIIYYALNKNVLNILQSLSCFRFLQISILSMTMLLIIELTSYHLLNTIRVELIPTHDTFGWHSYYLIYRSQGYWSSEGCWLHQYIRQDGVIVCKCNHLTSFSVMMSLSPDLVCFQLIINNIVSKLKLIHYWKICFVILSDNRILLLPSLIESLTLSKCCVFGQFL